MPVHPEEGGGHTFGLISGPSACYKGPVLAPKTPTARAVIPLLGGLVSLGGVVALALRRRRRRPTVERLLQMDDRAFEAYIRSTGLRKASDPVVSEG